MKALLLLVATWVVRVVPLPLADTVALAMADVCWFLLRRPRHALRENLRFTAGHASPTNRRQLARQTFRNLAICTVDFLRLPHLRDDEIRALVEISGFEHVDAARAAGRGVLFVSPHLGNFELGGRYLAAQGLPVAGFAEVPRDRWLRRVYQRLRAAAGVTIFALGDDARAATRHLKRGGLLALFADRAIGTRSHVVRFCDGQRPLPAGPAVLARLTGAAVVPSCLARTPAGPRRYRWVIEPPLALDLMRADEAAATQVIADHLSTLVRRYPDQWFVFDRQWRTPT